MRRTPDKATIAELKANGLTVRQIAQLYGVTPQSIHWAINFGEPGTMTPTLPARFHLAWFIIGGTSGAGQRIRLENTWSSTRGLQWAGDDTQD